METDFVQIDPYTGEWTSNIRWLPYDAFGVKMATFYIIQLSLLLRKAELMAETLEKSFNTAESQNNQHTMQIKHHKSAAL